MRKPVEMKSLTDAVITPVEMKLLTDAVITDGVDDTAVSSWRKATTRWFKRCAVRVLDNSA